MDKLLGLYSLRIPLKTKAIVDKLQSHETEILAHRLRVEMAKYLHELKFKPEDYLGE